MIHVIATIELQVGSRKAFLEEFRRIVPAVRGEAGCIEYGPTVDMTTDLEIVATPRANVVTVIEKWESLEALRAHTVAPHMREYRDRVKDLVSDVTIRVMEPAG